MLRAGEDPTRYLRLSRPRARTGVFVAHDAVEHHVSEACDRCSRPNFELHSRDAVCRADVAIEVKGVCCPFEPARTMGHAAPGDVA